MAEQYTSAVSAHGTAEGTMEVKEDVNDVRAHAHSSIQPETTSTFPSAKAIDAELEELVSSLRSKRTSDEAKKVYPYRSLADKAARLFAAHMEPYT